MATSSRSGKAASRATGESKALTREPRRTGRASRVNDAPPRELQFEQGDERDGRVGDPQSRRELREEFPPARVRDAGRTAGEVVDRDVTADDASPETLLDDERSRTPASTRGRVPQDARLSRVSAREAGLGGGVDEAEQADLEPVGRREAEALQRRVREHAADANFFERNEAEELAAAARVRRERRGADEES